MTFSGDFGEKPPQTTMNHYKPPQTPQTIMTSHQNEI